MISHVTNAQWVFLKFILHPFNLQSIPKIGILQTDPYENLILIIGRY